MGSFDRYYFGPVLLTATALVGLLPLLLSSCASKDVASEDVASGQPNIIVLLTDDQRWDALGYAGNDIIRTPHMDSLARNGVWFRNAYVTTPICAVSRASILSGQYARRHGIHDFTTSFTSEAFAQTYPALLHQADYYTGFIGKYGVGTDMPVERFDEWYGFAGMGSYHQQDSLGREIHLTRLMGNQAIGFLQHAPVGQPFALSISFKAPHVEGLNEFVPDPAYDSLYAEATIPPPATGADRYFEAFPAFFRANNEGRLNEGRARWKVRFSTPERYQKNVKRYYRLVTGVDAAVGRILGALRRQGLAESTVLILISDNGFYLGEHGLAGKWYGHEESIRVPLVIYDPRLPSEMGGRVVDAIALNIDLAPTILDWAGLPVPARMQGRSLVPFLKDEPPSDWRSGFFFEHNFVPKHAFHLPRSEGVIGTRYKYLRYLGPEPDYEVLYDLKADSLEITNYADSAAYRQILDSLRTRYGDLRRAVQ